MNTQKWYLVYTRIVIKGERRIHNILGHFYLRFIILIYTLFSIISFTFHFIDINQKSYK